LRDGGDGDNCAAAEFSAAHFGKGLYGVGHCNRQCLALYCRGDGEPETSAWYAGRSVRVTTNGYGLNIHNGDTGVVVVRDDRSRPAIAVQRALELPNGGLPRGVYAGQRRSTRLRARFPQRCPGARARVTARD
jgi:hypothetical protein